MHLSYRTGHAHKPEVAREEVIKNNTFGSVPPKSKHFVLSFLSSETVD